MKDEESTIQKLKRSEFLFALEEFSWTLTFLRKGELRLGGGV